MGSLLSKKKVLFKSNNLSVNETCFKMKILVMTNFTNIIFKFNEKS